MLGQDPEAKSERGPDSGRAVDRVPVYVCWMSTFVLPGCSGND